MTAPVPTLDSSPVMSPGHAPPPVSPAAIPATGDITFPVTWLTVTEACARSGVAKRTVRRWIAEARVVSRLEGEPGRQQRVIRADTLPTAAATGDILGDDTVTGTGARLNQRDSTAPGDDTGEGTGAGRGDDTRATGWERLVATQAEEISHLRAQLDSRTRAEQELRQLLAMSQQALQLALERPALPPHVEAPAPRKTRWWALWRR